MTQRRGFSESPAMRSSEAATGIPSRMRASSTSTTTGTTTRTTTSASADPRNNRLDAGHAHGRTTLGRESPGAQAPKARQHAQPETAALPTGDAVECGNGIFNKIYIFFRKKYCKHEFDLNDLRKTNIPEPAKPTSNNYEEWCKYYSAPHEHDSHTKRVMWPCSKCGKVFYAHCGLDILSHGTAISKVK